MELSRILALRSNGPEFDARFHQRSVMYLGLVAVNYVGVKHPLAGE
ncbi:hypothetical protein AVEN_2331-1, partial [Araneus ventricosus]